jgi:hypothetical protein
MKSISLFKQNRGDGFDLEKYNGSVNVHNVGNARREVLKIRGKSGLEIARKRSLAVSREAEKPRRTLIPGDTILRF